MKHSRIILFSWLAISAAIVAVSLCILFVWMILGLSSQRSIRAEELATAAAKRTDDLRLVSLARDTEDERTSLQALISSDVVAIVEALEKAGTDAGVSMKIDQTASSPTESTDLRTVVLVVDAEGTFPALMHAAHLLSTLPAPSAVDRLSFDRIPNDTRGLWKLDARVSFFTTRDISL